MERYPAQPAGREYDVVRLGAGGAGHSDGPRLLGGPWHGSGRTHQGRSAKATGARGGSAGRVFQPLDEGSALDRIAEPYSAHAGAGNEFLGVLQEAVERLLAPDEAARPGLA